MKKIDSQLLSKIADLHGIPQGAYNIRKNGKLLERHCVDGISITTKTDKPGIDIRVEKNVKNQSIHIPVLVTEEHINDLVYNDFFIGKNADILIVAGCGIHNDGSVGSSHDGIHEFFLEPNSNVRYVEKHYGEGKKDVNKDLNPTTILHLGKNSKFVMETVQIGGVSHAKRKTVAYLDENAILEVKESILTEFNQEASTKFEVDLNGKNSKVNLVSRSVAKGTSKQAFVSNINGNNSCFGHVECDAIVLNKAQVSSTPTLKNTNPNAELSHEAYIGKIAGEQLIKLQTLGLSKTDAEKAILKGFLNQTKK